MEIQLRKRFILNIEKLGMTTEQKRFMSQALLDTSTFTGIYTKRENDRQANGTARRKGGTEVRNFMIYSRMEPELKYRVHQAKRLKTGLKKLSNTKQKCYQKEKPSLIWTNWWDSSLNQCLQHKEVKSNFRFQYSTKENDFKYLASSSKYYNQEREK